MDLQDKVRGSYNVTYNYQGTGCSRAVELREEIRRNLFRIKNNVTSLERLLKTRTGSDRTVAGDIHRGEQAINQLAQETTKLFRQLSHYSQDRIEISQFERVRQEYKAVLKKYDILQQKIVRQVSIMVENAERNSDSVSPKADGNADQQQVQAQREVAVLRLIDVDLILAEEMNQQMQQIERDMLDVHQIFKDLHGMISDQGELVDKIEENMAKAAEAVEEAGKELVVAETYKKKHRKMVCIIVVVVVCIGAVLALILGLTLRK